MSESNLKSNQSRGLPPPLNHIAESSEKANTNLTTPYNLLKKNDDLREA